MRSLSRTPHTKTKASVKSIDENEPTITVEDRNIKTVSVSAPVMASIRESMERVLRSNPRVIKDVVRECLIADPTFVQEVFNEVLMKNASISQFAVMDKAAAKRLISEYISAHVGCKTSDIILNLEIDPSLVMEILKELKQEGVVQSKAIE